MKSKKRLVKNTLYILSLIFIAPLGIFLVLRGTWTKRNKIISSILGLLWILLFVYAYFNAPLSATLSNLKETGNASVEGADFRIEGSVYPSNSELKINDQAVKLNSNGSFSYVIPLKEGDNDLQVSVVKGNKVTTTSYRIHRLTKQEISDIKAEKERQEQAQADADKKSADRKATDEKAAADKKALADQQAAKITADKEAATAAATKAAADAEALRNAPKSTFGDGTYLVNKEIEAGTYRTMNTGGLCYYERLSGLSGSFNDILANGNPDGQAIVAISSSDVAFHSQRCGNWIKI